MIEHLIAQLNALEPLLRSFWYIAITTSLIFLVQTILTFIGSTGSEGLEADFDGDLDTADAPFQMFSFRNLINFLLGFSWTGIAFYHSIENKIVLVGLAFIVGVIFVLMFFMLIKQILKLTEDNTFNFQKLIGKTGQVYLSIPPAKTGTGKVQVSLNGSLHEIYAMTEDTQPISSSQTIKIVEIQDSILIVERI